jgi:hypothetical protein
MSDKRLQGFINTERVVLELKALAASKVSEFFEVPYGAVAVKLLLKQAGEVSIDALVDPSQMPEGYSQPDAHRLDGVLARVERAGERRLKSFYSTRRTYH